jgi:hypothetical protein
MNIIKQTIMHLLGVLASVLIKAGFPVIAYAHTGLEPKMEYVMLLGFAVGLIVGIASWSIVFGCRRLFFYPPPFFS